MVKINLKKGPDLRKFDPPNKPKFNLEKKPEPPRRELRDLQLPWIPKIEKPQIGLEPILGNFYGSPPIDPRDCEIYSDSPWCGGNPFSLKPISYDFSIVQDECNLGIQLNAELAFIKLPPVQIVYRSPGCQVNFDPPPDRNYRELPEVPNKTSETGLYVYFNPYFLRYRDGATNGMVGGKMAAGIDYEEVQCQIAKIAYKYNEFLGEIDGIDYNLAIELNVEKTHHENMVNLYHTLNGNLENEYIRQATEWGLDFKGDTSEPNTTFEGTLSCKISLYWNTFQGTRRVKYSPENNFFENQVPLPQIIGTNVYPEFLETINSYFTLDIQDGNGWVIRHPDNLEPNVLSRYFQRQLKIEGKGTDIYGPYYYGKDNLVFVRSRKYQIIWIDDFERLPPPLPLPMSCCPKTRENDELLRLIAKRLGAYDYPVSVPKILTNRAKGTESIENLTRFHSWLGKNLDALCGKFPIDIKIEDADLDQEGKQSQTVKIPNIAEALAEIVGYLLVIRSESDANLNATIRTLTEAGAAKQSAIIAGDYAKANAEFLGYKGTQVNRKVPFTFKPGESQLDKMLVNGYVDVKGWENGDKEDIRDILIPMLEMAAAYRAANFRNVGTTSTKEVLGKILKDASKYKTHVDTALEVAAIKKKSQKPSDEQKDSDLIRVPPDENRFDVFLEDAEKGFINKNGITNNTDPYDRPHDERPRIREIGDNTAK